ncbi:MAG: GNAT family N-acetyltransferase [Anaerolineae bacterium]|nr:GNAT family N-acetyltransferase [Anaerolineae bacterium]
MYGVESAVHPAYRGQGIGSRLMEARFQVVRALNLRGMVAGSAIMDYHTTGGQISAEQYVQEVIGGQRFDTNLSKQLHKGFQVHNLIPDYLEDDDEFTMGWGVTIVWHNPDYQPYGEEMPMK